MKISFPPSLPRLESYNNYLIHSSIHVYGV